MRHESPNRITPRVTLQKSKLLQGTIAPMVRCDNNPTRSYIKAPVHDQTADEVGIQDIVEVSTPERSHSHRTHISQVLDEIQAVPGRPFELFLPD